MSSSPLGNDGHAVGLAGGLLSWCKAFAVGVVIGADQQAGGGELLADVPGDGGQVAAVKGDEYRVAGGGVQAGGGGPPSASRMTASQSAEFLPAWQAPEPALRVPVMNRFCPSGWMNCKPVSALSAP